MVTVIWGRVTGLRQGGFSLLMTLLSLLILSLSAMAMMSLLKAGVSTSGNIAFRQAAVRAGDVGVEDAAKWIWAQSQDYLKDDHSDQGYYSTVTSGFNPGAFDFKTSARVHLAGSSGAPGTAVGSIDKVSDYTVYFVIHRMAMTSGFKCPDAQCLFPPVVTVSETNQGSSAASGGAYGPGLSAATGQVYYRVTVKVAGPRYNNRYVQAFVY